MVALSPFPVSRGVHENLFSYYGNEKRYKVNECVP